MVARQVHTLKVVGSSPISATKNFERIHTDMESSTIKVRNLAQMITYERVALSMR